MKLENINIEILFLYENIKNWRKLDINILNLLNLLYRFIGILCVVFLGLSADYFWFIPLLFWLVFDVRMYYNPKTEKEASKTEN